MLNRVHVHLRPHNSLFIIASMSARSNTVNRTFDFKQKQTTGSRCRPVVSPCLANLPWLNAVFPFVYIVPFMIASTSNRTESHFDLQEKADDIQRMLTSCLLAVKLKIAQNILGTCFTSSDNAIAASDFTRVKRYFGRIREERLLSALQLISQTGSARCCN